MKKYIGVKVVEANPMNLGDYNEYRGWTIPADEDPNRPGFLVKYPDGYESWCPKEVFEEANRPIDGMTFGHALEALKSGNRVARKGWNGKGMWLMLCVPDGDYTLEVTGEIYGRLPYIYMKTADNKLVPWLASQTDVLCEDWCVVS